MDGEALFINSAIKGVVPSEEEPVDRPCDVDGGGLDGYVDGCLLNLFEVVELGSDGDRFLCGSCDGVFQTVDLVAVDSNVLAVGVIDEIGHSVDRGVVGFDAELDVTVNLKVGCGDRCSGTVNENLLFGGNDRDIDGIGKIGAVDVYGHSNSNR